MSGPDGPGPEELSLGPGLGEREERRVDQTTNRHLREVNQKVVKWHPGNSTIWWIDATFFVAKYLVERNDYQLFIVLDYI